MSNIHYYTTLLEESIKRLDVLSELNNKNFNMWQSPKMHEIHFDETIVQEHKNDQYCILSISGTQREPNNNVAVLDKKSSCIIFYTFELTSLIPKRIENCKPKNHEIDVLGVKFSPFKNIYYIATQESITMYDHRASKISETYEVDIEKQKTKNINCFDVNCTERLIAAGTELIGGDAFILFWDTRYKKRPIYFQSSRPQSSRPQSSRPQSSRPQSSRPQSSRPQSSRPQSSCPQSSRPQSSHPNFLGGYWESHTDDITSLVFHPFQQNTLASGSIDGLMNVFDLAQSSEDQALTYTLNTESSVDRLGWLTDKSLWCTTHTETLQLWDCESASPYAKFERSDLAMSQDENPDDCYIVKVHTSNTLEPFLLAGCSTDERQYLRCLSLEKKKNEPLKICHDLSYNNQVVRDSWLHEESNTLLTAGEGSSVDIWKLH